MSSSTNALHATATEDGGPSMPRGPRAPRLKRELRWWHILMIGIGGTVGTGLFSNAGQVLAISGPGGALLSFVIVGLVAICVMEGICETIVLWPISNAMIEFVRAFVDRDLAIVVGIAYWYTYATTFIALIIGAGNLLDFWGLSITWKTVVFVVFPVTLALINSRGVRLYGDIELVGGIIKLIFVAAVFILMLCINAGAGSSPHVGNTCFNDGIRVNPNVADNRLTAVITAIPVVTYAYLGTELITVTAFEAVNPTELKSPAKNIAYYIFAIYVLNVLGFVLNVEWFNQSLPQFFKQPLVSLNDTALGHTPIKWPGTPSHTTDLPVIAAMQSNISSLPGLITACLVYTALSAGNTALYVASRTLYGLTRDLDPESDSRIVRLFAKFNSITPKTCVPGWAILISLVSFAWLPFIQFGDSFTQDDLQGIMVDIGSVGCVIVWASQCLAFIRYDKWLKKHRNQLKGNYARFNRWQDQGFQSWFSSLQPLPAWLGLISSLVIVLIFNSASMWGGKTENVMLKAVTVYLGPGILVVVFIILKLINRRGWIELGEWRELRQTLNDLDSLIYTAPPPLIKATSNVSVPMSPGMMPGSPLRAGSFPMTHSNGVVINGGLDVVGKDGVELKHTAW